MGLQVGEGLHHRICVDGFDVVHGVLGKDEIAPGHEESPLDALPEALFHVGNGSIFSKRDHLLSLDDLDQLGEDICSAIVVVVAWIAVVPQYVHALVSRVPVGLRGAPYPDQVVDVVVVGDAIVHQTIEGDGCTAALGSPPEPLSSRLM